MDIDRIIAFITRKSIRHIRDERTIKDIRRNVKAMRRQPVFLTNKESLTS